MQKQPTAKRRLPRPSGLRRSTKRDRVTTDEVILAFRQREDPELVLEVSEEWPGFSDLFDPLKRELDVSAEWYLETTARPFATDFRVVFNRDDHGPALSPRAMRSSSS